jgi:hypothetical protein
MAKNVVEVLEHYRNWGFQPHPEYFESELERSGRSASEWWVPTCEHESGLSSDSSELLGVCLASEVKQHYFFWTEIPREKSPEDGHTRHECRMRWTPWAWLRWSHRDSVHYPRKRFKGCFVESSFSKTLPLNCATQSRGRRRRLLSSSLLTTSRHSADEQPLKAIMWPWYPYCWRECFCWRNQISTLASLRNLRQERNGVAVTRLL